MNNEERMSNVLRDFYMDLQDAIDRNFEDNLFHRSAGLCENFIFWSQNKNHTEEVKIQLLRELRTQFKTAGLNKVYPFNSHLEVPGFWDETDKFQNETRLQWVEKHARFS